MIYEYTIDNAKYGLPAGDDDPVYKAEKWPLSLCMRHCQTSIKAFGSHVADLFGVTFGGVAGGKPEDFADRIVAVVGGGYIGSFIDEVGDFDFVASFKRMAHDGKLKRYSRAGIAAVYEDTPLGQSMSTNHADGLEVFYAGQPDVIMRLWWAMLCENSRPFANLHGWIAGALQRMKPARSATP